MSLFLVGPKKEKEIAQVWLMTNLMELLADWQYLAAQTHCEQGVDLFSGGPETKSSPMHVNMGQIVTSFGFFFPAMLNSVNLHFSLGFCRWNAHLCHHLVNNHYFASMFGSTRYRGNEFLDKSTKF